MTERGIPTNPPAPKNAEASAQKNTTGVSTVTK
jgi:hypothetical protein